MNVSEVRRRYLEFMREKSHAVIPSAPLMPENDPTTLFTGSGMQPLLPYLLGEKHPLGTRLVNSQKCFRAEDIEEIGDNRHTTFFEMLGNWSLGDYFKKEQLAWFFEFMTDEVGLDPQRLYVTVFAGDERTGIPKDTEAVEIWKELFAMKGIEATDVELLTEKRGGELGMQGGRIFYYDAKKNWWSRAGVPDNMPAGEPGGPDSEVFYDFGTPHDTSFGAECHPNCDCGRFVEIGNSVFMEYIKQPDGLFAPLPQKNVDFGGGLERIAAATIGDPDVFKIDVFSGIISQIESYTGTSYINAKDKHPYRIIADHVRGAVFMIADGIEPSNTDQGYVLRRLLRRAIRFADQLHIPERSLAHISTSIISHYADQYPVVLERAHHIENIIHTEEQKFRITLEKGMRMFEKISGDRISGKEAFDLYQTYGFPIEITVELAGEKGKEVDMEGFRSELAVHQELSRTGAEQKFKGGLAGHSDKELQYHTATHLLHKALQIVLGDHALQRGSNITPQRLRFDFAHPSKLTDEEKERVEKIVNEKIRENLPVIWEEMPYAEAQARGAIGLFEGQYGDVVKVYRIGDSASGIFSIELCGGPHVSHTGELSGTFKIQKEEAVSSGVRRIKAVLE